jgi:hypothetical protein
MKAWREKQRERQREDKRETERKIERPNEMGDTCLTLQWHRVQKE